MCVCVFIMGGKEQKGKVRIFEAPYSLLQKHLIYIKVGYYIVGTVGNIAFLFL